MGGGKNDGLKSIIDFARFLALKKLKIKIEKLSSKGNTLVRNLM